MQTITEKRYITGPELDRRHNISPVTRWRRVKAGIYPQPVRFSPGGRPIFDVDEIEAVERAKTAKALAEKEAETAHAA